MKNLINKFRSLSYEDRCVFTVKFSIIFNSIIAVGKFGLAIFKSDVFFFVAGVINVLMMMSKLECYKGIKEKLGGEDFKNKVIALFLGLSGIQYTIYMARLIYADTPLTDYGPFISIMIAFVAFVELGVAIYGCFKAVGKGYYFKNVKLINFCSALTAIVLTEVALMTFATPEQGDTTFISGLFGVVVGAIIMIIAAYILIQPKISILGKERNVYRYVNGNYDGENINIPLTNSKFYAIHYYEGKVENNIVDGVIKKGKSPIKSWNVWILVLVITLSEILIFPYAIGALVKHFKDIHMIDNLDNKMKELGFEKVEEGSYA